MEDNKFYCSIHEDGGKQCKKQCGACSVKIVENENQSSASQGDSKRD